MAKYQYQQFKLIFAVLLVKVISALLFNWRIREDSTMNVKYKTRRLLELQSRGKPRKVKCSVFFGNFACNGILYQLNGIATQGERDY